MSVAIGKLVADVPSPGTRHRKNEPATLLEQRSIEVRQNVIFELGWAAGRFGRDHVAVLKEDGVEMPSDYYGVVYMPFDSSGGWRMSLVGELKTAGFVVDANKVFPS